jgi:transglutaminase-like putative cysteine protease
MSPDSAAMDDDDLLSISHITEYRYSTRVELAHHIAHLTPRSEEHQSLEQTELSIDPVPNDLRNGLDAFGNVRSLFALYGPHEQLRVEATSRLRLRDRYTDLDPETSPPWEQVRDSLQYRASSPYAPASEFVFASPYVPRDRELAQYARASFKPDVPLIQGAIDLMHRVHADFRYCPDSTEVSTPLLQAFRARTGVCQDFSHVMIGCLRSIGLSARYISGYLVTGSGNGRPRPVGADASHAWVSVYCPASGWVDLDSTNDVIPRRHHVTVAVGRDYGDVAPLRGVIRGGGEHALEVAVRVTPVARTDQCEGELGAAGG